MMMEDIEDRGRMADNDDVAPGPNADGDGMEDDEHEENIWMPLMQNDFVDDDTDQDENMEEEAILPNAGLNDRMAEMAARRRQAQDMHSRRSKNRFLSYVVFSLGGGFLHIYWALCTRHQFYLAMVYLTSSKFAYVTMGNACICMTLCCFQFIVYLFLGGLRNVEQEAIGDGLRWGLMETCLAITIFRQEVDRHMVFLFLTLVLAKSLHWAVEYRGLHLQQTDMMEGHGHDVHEPTEGQDANGANQRYNHALVTAKWLVGMLQGLKKQLGFLSLSYMLLLLDLWAVVHCATVCATLGPSAHILFGFEAAILFISATNTLATHAVHWWDSTFYTNRNKTWHGRGTITFALEVALEGCKFLFYMIFFAIVFTYYGMPINIFRDLYMSYVNLKRKVSSFVKYRQLTSNMNARFEDATEQELEECGRTCIICRDDITTGHGNLGKKLPCSHIFHFYCLREWLQQQQSCPTCRSEIPASWSKESKIAAEARIAANAADNLQQRGGAAAAEAASAEGGEISEPVENDESPTGEAKVSEESQVSEESKTSADSQIKAALEKSTPLKRELHSQSFVFTPNTASQVANALADRRLTQDPKLSSTRSDWLLACEDGENWEDQSPFPCLYRVSAADGAAVYEQHLDSWRLVRFVACRKVILCTGMEWVSGGQVISAYENIDSTLRSQMMLRMPDGWVTEEDVERIPIPLSGFLDATAHSTNEDLPVASTTD